ncbi:beta-ketoacyl synthase N-terminal-like domain-containing protein [Streptomyces naphthomycinicus]|uniref:beta-ketoacyl synthase N-terminal-like domain-containing protein n=1 Tax=Streptomyces naphthomycinicus TaxID=2872625 RepID=UPI001CED0279|nr:beta-ketoacyl synthase N-terminal-like domain-containing protein [Streptomyces sp. TML10]
MTRDGQAAAGAGVAVTGVGVLTPAGRGIAPLWRTLSAGGARPLPIEHFDTAQAGTGLAHFVPHEPGLPGPGHPERMSALATAAVTDALADAGARGEGTALILATTDETGAEVSGRWDGWQTGGTTPRGVPLEERVAAACGLTGQVITVATTSAAGCVALGVARRMITSGRVRRVVVCGVDVITEAGFYGLAALRTLSPHGCRPFSADRSGIRISEAAAALVIEPDTPEGGRARGRLEGVAANNLAAQPARPEAEGVAAAVRGALRQAGRRPAEVDYVNAHAAGTRHGDAAELTALWEVFGDRLLRDLPVVSSKAAIGHCQGAAGVVEAVVSLATLERGEVLPTLGLDSVDPAWREHNLGGRRPGRPPEVAVSVSCGLGGVNAAVVLGADRTGPDSAGARREVAAHVS